MLQPRGRSRPGAAADLRMLLEAGMVYREARDFESARRMFKRVQLIDANEPAAEIGLGSTCFSEGSFAEATVHYQRALSLNPRSSYAYALLGEAQMFQGLLESAKVSLRRARELDPRGSYGRLAERLEAFVEFMPEGESLAKEG